MTDREKVISEFEDFVKSFSKRDDTYYKGLFVSVLALLKEQEEEHKRLLSWLSKFCRHIDNGDKWLTDEENLDFFRKKMKQQFGWDCD